MPRTTTPQKLNRTLVLASVCLVVVALYFARDVLAPLAMAVLLSFLLAPIVGRLERRLPRVLAVLITFVGAIGVVGVVGYVMYDQLSALADDLPQYRSNIEQKIRAVRSGVDGGFTRAAKTAEQIVNNATSRPTTQNAQAEVGVPVRVVNAPAADSPPGPFERFSLGAGLGSVFDTFATAGIVLLLVLFILLEREDLRNRMIHLIGQGRLTLTTQALDDAATRVSKYLTAQAMVNGTYGLTVAAGLWLIGLGMTPAGFPNFALWGLLCGVLRFIPYVGPWMGAAFPLSLAVIVFPGLHIFLTVLGMFVLIELISNNFMEPWLYGASTGMSAIAIIFAAVFWTWLWGPVGLILSTPLTVCLVVLGRYVPQLSFLEVLLGDRPVFEPHQALYQRLLALDEEESHELARDYLAAHTLLDLYDDMILPALALSEDDRHRGLLDERRADFIRTTLHDLMGDLEDIERAAADAPDAKTSAKTSAKTDPDPRALPAPVPAGCEVKVLCLPAHDDADELAARMLAQLLRSLNYCATTVAVTALASEMVTEVHRHAAPIVVVSAMPPSATLHARYLCKRLHAADAKGLMIVGLWSPRIDPAKAKTRIACAGDVIVTTTLRASVERIARLSQPLILRNENAAKADAAAPAPASEPAPVARP